MITYTHPAIFDDGKQIAVFADGVVQHVKISNQKKAAIKAALSDPDVKFQLVESLPGEDPGLAMLENIKADTKAHNEAMKPKIEAALSSVATDPEVWEEDGKFYTRNPAKEGWRNPKLLVHLKA